MHEVRVPKFGMSAVEVEILEILVTLGERVTVGAQLVEAASDKVDFMIEAEVAGVVSEIRCAAGDVVSMGEVLLCLEPEQG